MNSRQGPVPDDEIPGGETHGDWSGRVLAGRYELGRVLGTGGMAEVYAAVDRRLGRMVAVKVLRPELARDAKVRGRFRREAQAAASLNHPSVVAVHDTGEDADEPFIVMERVAGHTLRDVLHRGQPMPLDRALEVTVGVLTALGFAHRAGIVHRDIKPGNIMLTPEGAVKVMDFGIARAMGDDVTITQTVVGTPAYLSPEHAEGRPVDERSDLYSVGCVLFELLTGRPPFVAESAYVVAVQHIQEAPPAPSSLNPALPPVLDQIVAKALTKDREARYQTAAQFRTDLEAVRTAGTTGGAVPVPSAAQGDTTDQIVLATTARMPPPAPSGPPPVVRPAPVGSDLPPESAASRSVSPGLTGTAGLQPDGQDLGGQSTSGRDTTAPGRARRRRWPWVATAALLVVGGVAFALVRYGGGSDDDPTSEPDVVDVFDPASASRPSDADQKSSVVDVGTSGTVTVLDTRGGVRVLDPAGTVKPWAEPTQEDGVTVVTISTDVLFDYGQAEVGPGGQAAIVEAVRQAPDGASISVTGYTDSRGSDEANMRLSQDRADAVAAIITSERPDLTVTPVGKGSADPVAPNTDPDGSDNPDGRAQNRRVEIRYG